MVKYVLKRILAFIPTVIAISLLAFIISQSAPADPVEKLAKSADMEGGASTESASTKKVKQEIREKYGLNYPLFYGSITTLADSDTIHRIPDKGYRGNLKKLTREYGNWPQIIAYHNAVQVATDTFNRLSFEELDSATRAEYGYDNIRAIHSDVTSEVVDLLESHNHTIVQTKIDSIGAAVAKYSFLAPLDDAFGDVKNGYEAMRTEATPWKTYVPWPQWNGSKNQYHIWLTGKDDWWKKSEMKEKGFFGWLAGPWTREQEKSKGVLRGDFGESYVDGQPISTKIKQSFLWSFILSFLSIIIAYVVSLPSRYSGGILQGFDVRQIEFDYLLHPVFTAEILRRYRIALPFCESGRIGLVP